MSDIRQNMKRDMDLIRQILLEVEKLPPFLSYDEIPRFKIPDYTPDVVSYHIKIMTEKGLIESVFDNRGNFIPTEITWEGHDFLEAIRDDVRWGKVKSTMGKVGGFAYEVVKSVAISFMEDSVSSLLK